MMADIVCLDYSAEMMINATALMINAFSMYLKCYTLMEEDGYRNAERRRECFLHLIALGIQFSLPGTWFM